MNYKSILIERGFIERDITWSFKPKMFEESEGKCFEKEISIKNYWGEVAIILNKNKEFMDVYIANGCVVGCCGDFIGTYSFSGITIDKLLKVLSR